MDDPVLEMIVLQKQLRNSLKKERVFDKELNDIKKLFDKLDDPDYE
jgi:hypothetical protein